MKFAICNEIFQGWKFADTAAAAARAGYDAIELAPFTFASRVTDISAAERRNVRETAAAHGLAICGIHWVLARTDGLYLNHSAPEIRARTAEYLCALVDFCADAGGRIMVVGSPKQRNLLPGVSGAQAWDWAAETFRDSVNRAAARGVTICLEPLAPVETDFINTAADAIRFARQIGSLNFKIILDVKAMSAEPKPIPQIIRESWPEFAHFHANDQNLKGPGFGEIDFHPIAAALGDVGYDGYISVEVFDFTDSPETIANRSIEYLKHVFGNRAGARTV